MGEFKKELVFGIDNFQQQKVLSSKESIAQVLLNLFFMRPGNIPSLPHIGINIRKYLYKFEDELDADDLKEQIYNQCSDLVPYLSLGEVKIFVAKWKGQSILMIVVPLLIDQSSENVVYAFSKSNDDINFNYEFTNQINV